MNTRYVLSGIYAGVLACFCASASAELLIDPVGKSEVGKGEVGAFFGSSNVGYSATLWGIIEITPDVKRQYISAYYAHGLSENIDLFVAGGFILKAKADNEGSTSGDSGFMFGGGARGNIDLELAPDVDVSWYAQFLMINEDYGSSGDIFGDSVDLEASIKDLSVGAMMAKTLKEGITIYGGPEFSFYSDGDLDWSESYGGVVVDKGTESFERDDSFGLRFGAKKEINGMIFSLNAALMNESSFSIGVSMPFEGIGGSKGMSM